MAMTRKIFRKGAETQRRQSSWFLAAIISAGSLLLAAYCLLPTAFRLLPSASSAPQVETPQPQASPSPATPSPSPSPTPVTGLHQWGAVTLFHGLPSDRVRAITQDRDGVLWFGTEGGLAKFDGRRTQVVTDPELPNGRVLALQLDQDDVLWIGTDSGAARLANGAFKQIKELDGKTINAIITPAGGRAIMATEQGSIYECQVQTDGSVATKSLLAEPLQSADTDHPGPLPLTSLTMSHDKLLAGSLSRGVLAIDSGRAVPVELRPQSFFIRALETDAHGQLWVGAKSQKEESGFFQGDDLSRVARVAVPTGTVSALRFGGHDDMWVGSDGHGVFHFTGPKSVVHLTFDGTLGGLRSDHVYAIFVDREDVIWFGTDRGVSRYDPKAPRVESVGDNPQSNFVRVLYQTADGKLLSGTNRGLFVYDKASSTWRPVTSLSRNIIYALAEDKSGHLLVGSAGGFYAGQHAIRGIELENETFTRVEAGSGEIDAPGNVRAIVSFQGSMYLASYGHGVERVEGSHARLIWPNDSGAAREREVVSLFADGDARLLIGTSHGEIYVFDGSKTELAPSFGNLADRVVRAIDRGGDGTLWLATSRGVYACKQGAACALASPELDARGVTANHDANVAEALCATNGAGMLKILLDPNLGPIVSHIDIEHGLPSQSVFSVLPQRDQNGNDVLLIGTSRGVAFYEPGRTPPTLSPTRIISKRIHQPDELRAGLNLEYPQNSLLIDVTATSSRTFPEQFQYAFVLQDSKGQTIRQKLARDSQFAMEGLKAGKYKVTVRAFTKDLVPSSPLSFEFTVARAPFPWTSTALAVLLMLALLALTWAIRERRRIARTSAALVVANRELAGARLDLANEAERERRRIARDLHDQTLADLRRLLLITDRMPGGADRTQEISSATVQENKDSDEFNAATFRSEIESVSNEIRRICEDLSPSVLDNVGLAAALEWALSNAVAHLPSEKKFEYAVNSGDEIEDRIKLDPGIRIQIYRIAQEVINNICRHGRAKHVRLSLQLADAGLALTIEDDGPFFAPVAGQVQGRGLANIQARASLIDASVGWTRSDDGGTMFVLRKNSETNERGQAHLPDCS
jgi:signal transduction histidine kinase/ligand-binding sensor domain-containing protein